jgi:hypothetical protein
MVCDAIGTHLSPEFGRVLVRGPEVDAGEGTRVFHFLLDLRQARVPAHHADPAERRN